MDHIFEITHQKLASHCDAPVDRGLLRFVLIRNFCSSVTPEPSYGEEEWLDDCLDDCRDDCLDDSVEDAQCGAPFFNTPLTYAAVLISSPF